MLSTPPITGRSGRIKNLPAPHAGFSASAGAEPEAKCMRRRTESSESKRYAQNHTNNRHESDLTLLDNASFETLVISS